MLFGSLALDSQKSDEDEGVSYTTTNYTFEQYGRCSRDGASNDDVDNR